MALHFLYVSSHSMRVVQAGLYSDPACQQKVAALVERAVSLLEGPLSRSIGKGRNK